jgi:acyl-CoA synthetase (AMP-forming)/AMP-acid ligase II
MQTTQPKNHNISLLVSASAKKFGNKAALVTSIWDQVAHKNNYTELSYQDFEQYIDQLSHAFVAAGISNNDRVLLMVPPGRNMISSVFALLRMGAIVVMVDGGIEIEKMLGCIKTAQPTALVGVQGIIQLSVQFPDSFANVRTMLTLGEVEPQVIAACNGNIQPLANFITDHQPFTPVNKTELQLSIILFTSGSTGSPKGVEYTPRMIQAQLAAMRQTWQLSSDDIDMPVFPAFTIGSIGIGMTVVVPNMDAVNPAQADPERIIQALVDYKISYSFGAPAFWLAILQYCKQQQQVLPQLRVLLVGGAPVPDELILGFSEVLINGQVQVTLGATEASAVVSISQNELVVNTLELTRQGNGVCVGRAVAGSKIATIAINDQPIEKWSDADTLAAGVIGELVVTGDNVSHHYYNNQTANKHGKIPTAEGDLYHRMGDAGYIDRQGRFWFCGRVAQLCYSQGQYWYPSKIEAVLDSLAGVRRTALVTIEVKQQHQLVVCIELMQAEDHHSIDQQQLFKRLTELNYPVKYIIESKEGFPVDIRHNSKINRPALSQWAQQLHQTGDITNYRIEPQQA